MKTGIIVIVIFAESYVNIKKSGSRSVRFIMDLVNL